MKIQVKTPSTRDINAFVELSSLPNNYHNKYNKEYVLKNNDLNLLLDKIKDKSLKTLEKFKEDENMLILIATLDEKTVGYVLAYVYNDLYGYLDELFVEENARRQGVGKELLKKTTEWMQERNAKKITINSDLCNKNSVLLYEKVGFKKSFMGYIKNF